MFDKLGEASDLVADACRSVFSFRGGTRPRRRKHMAHGTGQGAGHGTADVEAGRGCKSEEGTDPAVSAVSGVNAKRGNRGPGTVACALAKKERK